MIELHRCLKDAVYKLACGVCCFIQFLSIPVHSYLDQLHYAICILDFRHGLNTWIWLLSFHPGLFENLDQLRYAICVLDFKHGFKFQHLNMVAIFPSRAIRKSGHVDLSISISWVSVCICTWAVRFRVLVCGMSFFFFFFFLSLKWWMFVAIGSLLLFVTVECSMDCVVLTGASLSHWVLALASRLCHRRQRRFIPGI